MKRVTIVGLIIVLASTSLSFAKQPEYKPGSVIVRFTDPCTSTAAKNNIINTALNRTGSPVKREFSVVKGLALVQLPADINVECAIASLKQSSSVVYAVPDYICRMAVVPNDARFGELWGMTKIGAPTAWNYSTGSSSIIVAVTDTGIDPNHPDIAANLWSDTDGTHGYDFINNDSDPFDDQGHGTHVSGTIGAMGNNGVGVAGINWRTKIMAVKCLDANGFGSTSAVVSAVQYARQKQARVINASLGWPIGVPVGALQPLYDAIAEARDAGIIYIAAAGNDYGNNNDSSPVYPASFDLANIISVMATTNTDVMAVFSNYGLTTVDLGAPGETILSTIPGNQYGNNAGTSMAAPHVAGASALLLSIDPTLTYSQVKQILLDTVDKTLPGLCVSGGRLNLSAAAQEAAVDTTPPTPNPPQWAAGALPKATGKYTVTMRVSPVTDRSGVEYYYECVNDVNINSGWTANTQYSFTTLEPNTTYGFYSKARDKSGNHNETGWSPTVFATTADGNDTLPPFPDPPQWLTLPKANFQTNQIRMAAGIGYDESTPVQYQFSYNYGANPEVILPWQSSNLYYFTPPSPDPTTVYNFKFHVRDANGVETDSWSPLADARMYNGSRVLSVPIPYPTIQNAIDNTATNAGDIVEVSPGVYYENNINFKGKAITVKSLDPTNPAIVDCGFAGRGFVFKSGEGASSILEGIIIRNGIVSGASGGAGLPGLDAFGGGILCGFEPGEGGMPSSPTIRNCTIDNCRVIGGNGGAGAAGNDVGSDTPLPTAGGKGGDSGKAHGGGIYVGPSCNLVIQDCTINNCASIAGNGGNGGAGGDGNEVIPGAIGGNGGNITDFSGGGIYVEAPGNPSIIGGTVSGCFTDLDGATPGAGGPGGGGNPPGNPGRDSSIIGLGNGGGLFFNMNSSSSNNIKISVVNLTSNIAYNNGGGAGFGPANGKTPTISDCQFSGNYSGNGDESPDVNEDGGGLWFDNASGKATLVLSNCNFSNNISERTGGAIKAGRMGLDLGSKLQIYNSSFSGNSAQEGGGIYLERADLFMSESVLADNSASEGGAINGYLCKFGIEHSRFTGNQAVAPAGIGGGVAFWNSDGDINNCLLSNNTADTFGGAAFMNGWTTSPLRFTNCLITDNEARYEGGALSCNLSGWAKLINCTLAGNSATSTVYGTGGAISSSENFAWVQLENCILWENEAINGPQIAVGTIFGSSPDGAGPFADVDVTNCDVQGGVDDVFIEDWAYTAVWWLAGNIDDDPLFVDVVINEPGYYLSQVKAGQLVNSPCVDVGGFAASELNFLVGLDLTLTTRTDSIGDANTVDMGYHYVAGVAKKYNLTIDVYEFDPCEGGHGRLKAKAQPGSDYQFDINDTNTIQISQATQVELIAAPDPCFKVQYWSGTDNDGLTALTNTVTMNDDKRVVVAFAPDGVYYLTVTVIGNGTVTPLGRTLHRHGDVVTLTALPNNPTDKVDWTGTDNDASETQINAVTMTAHKDVTVEFYTPRVLHVGGDMNYPNIQMAIDDADNRDIVLITAGTYNIVESSQDRSYLLIDKDITITSTSPENPGATVITGKFMISPNVSRKCVIQGLTIRDNIYWDIALFTGPNTDVFLIEPAEAGADGPPAPWTYGAGMTLNGSASPTVRNVNFVNCQARGIHGADGAGGGNGGNGGPGGRAMGGGAYCGEDGSPLFVNCLFTGCLARGGDAGNGGDNPAGHGGAWGDKDGPDPDWDYGPMLDYWRYTGCGGAVYCDEGSTAEFINCNFIDNTTIGVSCGVSGAPFVSGWPYSHYKIQSFGGAVYAATGSAPTFADCNFTDNMADPNGWPVNMNDGDETVAVYPITSYGGAIAFETGASPLFTKCTFTANLAAAGGAVYCDESYPEFDESSFVNNTALHGGGVMFSQGYSIINRCFFTGNEGTYPAAQGGAISALGANGEITDCNINGNRSAGNGGGIYVSSRNIDGTPAPGGSSVLIKNCLIINNAADLGGGGVAAVWYSDPNIVNCTIANNTTGEGVPGGGLLCSYGSFANIINTIIWGNMGDTAGAQFALRSGLPIAPTPSTANVSYSVIGPPSNSAQAAIEPAPVLTIDVNNNANALANTILGPGIELVGNATYMGADAASGLFRGGLAAGIGIESGIIMTCGLATNALPPNNNNAITFDNGMPGDADLLAVLQAADPEATNLTTNNAAVLEFTFTSSGGNLFFNFVFASEEYFEFVNSQFNDIFAFFLDGTNIALIPGATRPVSINNVNGGNPIGTDASNPQLYKSNDPCQPGGAPFTIQYDGFTNVFTARALNAGSGTHTIKIALADAGDSALDSAVFIEAGSFSDTPLYSEPVFVDVCSVLVGWDSNAADPNNPWAPSTHNLRIDSDPCFVGRAGYFLSQIAAGQLFTSPCVDAGSADVNAPGIDLASYTTRTDSVADLGIVDMGYHYPFFTPPQYRLDINVVDGNGLTDSNVTPVSGMPFDWFRNVPLEVNCVPPPNFQIGWTGTNNDDSNSNSNAVLMDRPRTVTVAFVSNSCTLTAEVIGGHGTISVAPEGPVYTRNTVITLTAVPDAGYRIKKWTGTNNDGSFGLTNFVIMAGDKHVTIEFEVPGIKTVPGDFTTIQGAINAARTGDIVSVASGVYNTPDLEINKEITITSTNPDDPCVVAMTVIDGSGMASRGVIFGSGATGQTVLNGITIANVGYSQVPADDADTAGEPGPDGDSSEGGGILVRSGASPTIKNCIIRNCNIIGGNAGAGGNADATTDAGHGGWAGWARGAGIYVASNADPNFINCTITGNTATGGNGGNGGNFTEDGGDAGYGGNWSDGVLWQTWGYIGDYRFYSGYGAGVFCDVNSSATFIACSIINNTASGGLSGIGGNRETGVQIPMPDTAYRLPGYGGGVYCGENSNITFVDCNIKGNLAPKPDATYHTDPYLGHGGGIAFENTAAVTLTGCNISDNISAVGGGMFWLNSAPVIRDCNISSNIAYVGGGIFGQDGAPLIEDCNIYRNFAGVSTGDVDVIAGQGGGIFGESMNANIIDCRFVDNRTDASGAAIYFHGPVSGGDNTANVTNCLMTGNTAGRDGGGISANWNISVDIANCTLHSNNATGDFGDPNGHTGLGGGLYCAYGAITNVIDSIIWRNDANFGPEIAIDTGFELDQHCGSVSVSYSDVRGGSAGVYIGEAGNCGANLTWGSGNIGADPRFVSEIISDYRLQQLAAGQEPDDQSPCADAGSTSAVNVGLGLYTTRTDDVPDRGIVDMGYHYLVEQPCRFVDIGNKILTGDRDRWMKDGIIDWTDFIVLADSWLSTSCSPVGEWCHGADLTFNGVVNWEDLSLISQCWLTTDTTAPAPNPSQWRIVPMGVWPNKVKMAAVDSIDRLWGLRFDTTHPVQYQFDCTSGNGHDRDWEYDANYTDTGLQSYTEYAYRVRARDLVGNMTEWSSVQWTVISPDSISPTPNPMTWEIEPYAASGSSVSMRATTADDSSGGIQYEFEINEPNIVYTSGWRDDPNYTVTGLDPIGPYCFRVRARDVFDNETGWSVSICVSNLGDVTPPAPAPTILWLAGNWNVFENAYEFSGEFRTADTRWWHRVVADVTGIADDSGGPIEIRFICSSNGFSSSKKVADPIIIAPAPPGNILGGHGAGNTYQVFWTGNTIVYDVYINTSSGLGGDYTWTVCVYDPTQNDACSDPVEIAPLYIGPPR
jgi:hypothetical protein